MQDSLMHMVDILLSYVFSTNPGSVSYGKNLLEELNAYNIAVIARMFLLDLF